jgi:hypothetical protein
MSLLRRLHLAGWAIWPFDPPGWPLALEIYPRLLTGAVVKSSRLARAAYLAARFPALDPALAARAGAGEDAFDAAVSALVMAEHAAALASLPSRTDPLTLLEGEIWRPPSPAPYPDDVLDHRKDRYL